MKLSPTRKARQPATQGVLLQTAAALKKLREKQNNLEKERDTLEAAEADLARAQAALQENDIRMEALEKLCNRCRNR